MQPDTPASFWDDTLLRVHSTGPWREGRVEHPGVASDEVGSINKTCNESAVSVSQLVNSLEPLTRHKQYLTDLLLSIALDNPSAKF